MEKYKDSSLSVEERVEDLLERMTLKEKVGQLNQNIMGWHAFRKTEQGFEITQVFKDEIAFGDGVGALYGVLRADPWSRMTFENGIGAKDSARVINMLQRYVIENTRLGIPMLMSEECPHGHQALEATLFPVNTGIGTTWNPKLYEEAFSCVAAEIRSRGGNLGFISALDMLQDPRWGRSEECYSEDPYLGAKMTEAVVKGLQGSSKEDLKSQNRVAAVVKHFCAQGAAVGGHNGKCSVIGERELREIHMPGMKAAVKAGAMACMAAYPEIDGVPCHANKKLLNGVLREEWNFEGFVMSDGCGVDNLLAMSGDYETAGAMALSSGVDMNLWNIAFTKLEEAVSMGKISEMQIDDAVRRVLRVKFLLGLFENPYVEESLAGDVVGSSRIKDINLKVAREAVVLLKNENNTLPINKSMKKIAVIGPNADNIYNQLGDYTASQKQGSGITVLQGIKSLAPENTKVVYAKGCGIRSTSREGFEEAIDAARNSDVAVLVLGGSSARDFNIQFAPNGAAIVSEGLPSEMDCGEGVDVADLELGGVQVELTKEIAATGTPVVVVLIQGRPHSIPWIAENCDAVLCAWYPGQEGGKAIAEILFGEVNPSGKLPVSIPRSSVQLPVYYNYKSTCNYCDMPAAPLYHFGYGLSYTSFEYSNLSLQSNSISKAELDNGKIMVVSVDVKNTGSTAGAEVAQLYIFDMEASITRRNRELKGFEKLWLEPDEKKTVSFCLGREELSVWNSEMKYTVEPGNIKVMAGGNSVNTLDAVFKIVQ